MSEINLVPFLSLSDNEIRTFYEIRYSDYVHQNFGGKKPDIQSHIKWVKSVAQSENYKGFSISLKKEIIGGCSLKNISHVNHNAEFDIFLSKDFTGKGYGKIALEKLLKIGFVELKLHRIYAFLLESNKNAYKMYSDIGFKKEGVLRENVFKNKNYSNSIIIGLLKEEYERSN